MKSKSNAKALIPLLVFLIMFMGAGVYFTLQGKEFAFYQLPSPIAALFGIVVAFLIGKGSISKKTNTFVKGIGDSNIVMMCIIYLLAGAFGHVAQAMGSVDSTVNLGLSIIPPKLILPGLFLIASFVSLAMGTSMGTIASVTPIATQMACKANLPLALCVGAVFCGAMFGDNLSMISDTTIAAINTQGCNAKDKFIMNLQVAGPAALITLIILICAGAEGQIPTNLDYSLLKILPYIAVLVLALMGMSVFIVLTVGIFLAGGIGLIDQSFTFIEFTQHMYEGFGSMQEILILSMLIGGLAALMAEQGGIEYLLNKVDKYIKTSRGAELGIAALVSLADVCTANNTVAIVITSPMAKKLSDTYDISPVRSATWLGIFSCVWQGIIPYGAQVLLAGSIAKLSPLEILPTLYYPYILGIIAISSILIGFPRTSDLQTSIQDLKESI